jgi:hypothetical protein
MSKELYLITMLDNIKIALIIIVVISIIAFLCLVIYNVLNHISMKDVEGYEKYNKMRKLRKYLLMSSIISIVLLICLPNTKQGLIFYEERQFNKYKQNSNNIQAEHNVIDARRLIYNDNNIKCIYN